MEVLTGFGKTILAADAVRIRLDQTVKSILAYRPLLARIFKEVVSECRYMNLDEIEACIEGEIQISEVFVDGGLSNVGERINGLSTEAYLNEEGLNRYDIRTYLKVPGDRIPNSSGDIGYSEIQDKAVDLIINERSDSAGDLGCGEKPDVSEKLAYIKLLVNVEAQNDDKPGYDISLRALFYCCRMISAQQGVEFNTDADDPVKYGNIRKVYSIWVCTETAQKRANSIEKYGLDRTFLVGNNEDAPRYDIMNAIVINISKVHDTGGTQNELIRLLTDLFDERLNGAEKVKKLKDDYGLQMTKKVETEVKDMCTYSIAMENKGMENGLKALVRTLREYTKDFESLYSAVVKNDEYKTVTREEIKQLLE